MSGRREKFVVEGVEVEGYLAEASSGSGPVVVVIQEWWGLVPHICSVADRLAAEGFHAFAPDLYRGETTTRPDDAGRRMMELNIAQAGREIQAAARAMRALDAAQPKKVAVLGFCMGGQLALHAACSYPKDFEAVVDFYGIHPKAEIDLAALEAPVLAHFADHDEFVPKEKAEALVRDLESLGKDTKAHFYPAGHAFFNDSRPEAFHAAEATKAWERTLAFLNEHLR